jgi:ribosomal protein S18 acetylase RimI-like enzyme
MIKSCKITSFDSNHSEATAKIVIDGFMDSIANDCTDVGIKHFSHTTSPASFIRRTKLNYFIKVAVCEEELVGMIEIKEGQQISRFFVKNNYRRRGVGKMLLDEALKECITKNPALLAMAVKSSASAINVYEKMGFVKNGDPCMEKGILYTPMLLQLENL